MKKPLLLIFASALAISACNTQQGNHATEQKQGTQAGINTAWMDKSVLPGNDFFAYANGSWVKNTAIPADRSSIGGFFIADQQREKNTRELFDGIIKSNPTSGNDALIANY
jgi:predicted metalloendopeptidase